MWSGWTSRPTRCAITFNGGKTHNLTVGSVTPIQDGYYTSLDGGPVQVVDKTGLDALIPLVEQPPYAATLTPAVPPTVAPPADTATPIPATRTRCVANPCIHGKSSANSPGRNGHSVRLGYPKTSIVYTTKMILPVFSGSY